MIDSYNKTPLGKFVDYNDEDVHLLSENLFEKIRGTGILPSYIVRDKDIRVKNDIDVLSGTYISYIDNDFTFGNCVSCSQILSESNIDLYSAYSINFEVKAKGTNFEEINLFDVIIIRKDEISFNSTTYTLSKPFKVDTHYKISLIKSISNLKLLVNNIIILDVNIVSINISSNKLLESDVTMRFSNLLILNNENIILGYWKMNFISSSNKYIDSGDGDYDFYSFWFSNCYIISLINKYRDKLLLIQNNDFMLKRFIESKGIAI